MENEAECKGLVFYFPGSLTLPSAQNNEIQISPPKFAALS